MPFVTINVLEGKGKDYIKKVSDSVNEAVIETMAFRMMIDIKSLINYQKIVCNTKADKRKEL